MNHQRRSQHQGGDQSHQQRVMCQQCGEEEHFPADCVITMPAPAPRHHSYAASSLGAHAAQYSTGVHVAQYGTYPLSLWTSHNSDGQSTSSTYGPAPHQSSLETCPADATTAQICWASISAGASFGFRLELLLRAIPGFTATIRASRRVSEFGFD